MAFPLDHKPFLVRQRKISNGSEGGNRVASQREVLWYHRVKMDRGNGVCLLSISNEYGCRQLCGCIYTICRYYATNPYSVNQSSIAKPYCWAGRLDCISVAVCTLMGFLSACSASSSLNVFILHRCPNKLITM